MTERDPRFLNAAPISLTHCGTTLSGWVVDLSNRGARLLGPREARFGDIIDMRVGDESISAIVRWTRTGITGVEFDAMLGPKMTELMRRFRGPSRRGARRVGSFGFHELTWGGPQDLDEEQAEFGGDPGTSAEPEDTGGAEDSPNPPPDARPARFDGAYRALAGFRGEHRWVTVRNYSRRGLCVAGLGDAHRGESLTLQIGSVVVWGGIRWSDGTLAGVMLTTPLSPAQRALLD
jgi:hypothetical protein